MSRRNPNRVRESAGTQVMMVIIYTILALSIIVCLFPFIYVIANSLSDPNYVISRSVYFLPKGFSLGAYELVFETEQVWVAYRNTIVYTVLGTLISTVTQLAFAYPLSRKDFSGRRFFNIFILITMFFSGGTVPLFIVVNNLKLYNTIWGVLLPMSVSTWNVIIARTFFHGIPSSLHEAAMIDGANDLYIMGKIIVPLSKPIISVVALYSAVAFWNAYFIPMIMTTKESLQPLQIFLMKVVVQNSSNTALGSMQGYERLLTGSQLKYAVIIVAILPIICVYPFLQKYFIKGVLIGSVKE